MKKEVEKPIKIAIKRSFKKEDFSELGVLLVYLVQNGAVQIDQLQDTLRRLGARVTLATLKSTLESLKDRDFLARDQRLQDHGQLDYEYKVKKIRYSLNNLSTHDIDEIIPSLLSTPEGMLIKSELETSDKKDRGKPVYYNYGRWFVKFMLRRPMLGSQPVTGNNYLIEAYKKSPHKSPGFTLDTTPPPVIFERDWWSGSIVIHRGVVRGFIELVLRRGLKETNGPFKTAAAEYTYTKSVYVNPKQGISHQVMPIQANHARNGGAGLATYEVLLPGEMIQMVFDFPMSVVDNDPSKLLELLQNVAEITPRAPSPGRGSQTGDMILLRADYRADYESPKPAIQRLYQKSMKDTVSLLKKDTYDEFPKGWDEDVPFSF